MDLRRESTPPRRWWRALHAVGTVVIYALMLLAVVALWNNDAPQFIYVAF